MCKFRHSISWHHARFVMQSQWLRSVEPRPSRVPRICPRTVPESCHSPRFTHSRIRSSMWTTSRRTRRPLPILAGTRPCADTVRLGGWRHFAPRVGSRQGRCRVWIRLELRLGVQDVSSHMDLAQRSSRRRRRVALTTRHADAAAARQVLPTQDVNRKLENRSPARNSLPHRFPSSRIAGQSALNVRVGARSMMSFR